MTIKEEMEAMMAGEFTSKIAPEIDTDTSSDEIEDETAGTVEDNTETITDDTNDDTEVQQELEGSEGATDVDDSDQVPEQNDISVEQETNQSEEQGDEESHEIDEQSEEPKQSRKKYKQLYEEMLAKYEEAEEFKRKVTSDFKANGQMVKGISDPDKILKNMQMSIGLTKKLEGYKSVKPLLKPLEERGLLQDTEKFDMLMKIADGDKDALKYYLKTNEIDPIDLDYTDEDAKINYDPSKSTLPSQEELIYNDMYETADTLGVAEEFNKVVLNEWDSDSASKLFADGGRIGKQLAEQMQNGLYDQVMSYVNQLKLTEPTFNSLSAYDQYNEAAKIVNRINLQQNATTPQPVQTEIPAQPQIDPEAIKAELQEKLAAEMEQKLAAERAKLEQELMQKIQNEQKIEQQREAAVRMSQANPTTPQSTQQDKSPKIGTEDFRAYWRELMSK